jgi:hypothetical protein
MNHHDLVKKIPSQFSSMFHHSPNVGVLSCSPPTHKGITDVVASVRKQSNAGRWIDAANERLVLVQLVNGNVLAVVGYNN